MTGPDEYSPEVKKHERTGATRTMSESSRSSTKSEDSLYAILDRRVWPLVDKTPDCWNWLGTKDQNGYAVLTVNVKVHRFTYEMSKGKIPKGLVIDHLCRNPSCVNPAHLEAVTQRENTLRGISPIALNMKKIQCPKGHPLKGDNLQPYALAQGKRICRICYNERMVKWHHKRVGFTGQGGGFHLKARKEPGDLKFSSLRHYYHNDLRTGVNWVF